MNDGPPATSHAPDPRRVSQTNLAVARPMVKELAIRAEGVSYWYGDGETRTQVLFDNDAGDRPRRGRDHDRARRARARRRS